MRKHRLSARGRTDRAVLDGCRSYLEGLRAVGATQMRVEVVGCIWLRREVAIM